MKTDCRAMFGAYAEASTYAIVTDDMTPMTHGCLSLGTSSNMQRLLMCLDLKIVRIVTCRTIEVVPMPDKLLMIANLCQ